MKVKHLTPLSVEFIPPVLLTHNLWSSLRKLEERHLPWQPERTVNIDRGSLRRGCCKTSLEHAEIRLVHLIMDFRDAFQEVS